MATGGWKNILGERWVTRKTADKASGVSAVVVARLFSTGPLNVIAGNAAVANSASSSAVGQTHLVAAGNVAVANAASSSGVSQTNPVTAGNADQANAASAAAIGQTHQIAVSSLALANVASPAQSHTPLNRSLRVDPDPLEDGYLIIGDEGGQLVTVANATQANAASGAAVSQVVTVLVTVADTVQANAASAAAVQATQQVTVGNVSQANAAAAAAVTQSHLVSVANATQGNAVTAGSVSQASTTFVAPANADQANATSAAEVKQTHLVGAASVVQANAGTATAINQIHQVFSGGVVQTNAASSAAIRQTHLVSVFSGTQANLVSGASAGHVVSGIGHVWRIDTSPFYTDTLLIGDPGFGLLGSQIAATGDDGPGYLYNDISLPADADKEISGEIVTWPLHGELFADEDGSFIYTPDTGYVGTDSFEYQLRVEGAATGSPTLVELTVVGDTQYITIGEALQGNSTSQAAVNQTHLATVSSVAQANSASSVAINQSSETLVVAAGVVQANSASQVAINQTHLVGGESSTQANTFSQVSVNQTHLLNAANATQANAVTPSSIALDGAHYIYVGSVEQANNSSSISIIQVIEGNSSSGTYDEVQARAKVHGERVAKVQQYQKLLEAQKKAAEEKPIEVPALLKPTEQIVINETALRYTQEALSLTGETQAFEISPELVQKLAEIRQVAIEQVEIPEIAPEHLALIRNNDDALAMILIYWGFEDEA